VKAAMTASPCRSKTSASQVKLSINWSINSQAPPRDNFIKRGSQRPLPRAALGPTRFALRAAAGLLTAHVRRILGNAESGPASQLHQFSPKGLTSTSNVQAEGGCCASHTAVAAMSSGFRKKLSGLSGMFRRVPGRSTTASITIKAT